MLPIVPEMKGMVKMAVYKRGNTWAYKVYYYDSNNKQRVVSKSGFKRKSDAEKAMILRQSEMLNGRNFDKENTPFATYSEQWIKLYKLDTVSVKTQKRYETIIQYIKENYNLPLKALSFDNYQAFLNKLAETRSKATVKKYHEVARKAIQDALKKKIILTDVTDGAILKGNGNSKSEENKFLSKSDFYRLEQALLKDIKPEYTSRYIILLAMYTGMRFGECLGLQWGDIQGNVLNIQRGYDYHYTHDVTDGKTKNAARKIIVPYSVIELLNTLPKNSDFVFTRVSNNAVNDVLMKMQGKINIEKPITFHGLRHTHASILLYEGVNILSISKRLGHGSVTITMEIYSHVIDELQEREEDKILEILEKALSD